MARFIAVQDNDTELGGNMGDLLDTPLAINILDFGREVEVNTDEFGKNAALRVRVLNAETGEDYGVRLVFWSGVRRQLRETSERGIEWAVGQIVHEPQLANPDRSIYRLVNAPVSNEQVGRIIDEFESKVYVTTAPVTEAVV